MSGSRFPGSHRPPRASVNCCEALYCSASALPISQPKKVLRLDLSIPKHSTKRKLPEEAFPKTNQELERKSWFVKLAYSFGDWRTDERAIKDSPAYSPEMETLE